MSVIFSAVPHPANSQGATFVEEASSSADICRPYEEAVAWPSHWTVVLGKDGGASALTWEFTDPTKVQAPFGQRLGFAQGTWLGSGPERFIVLHGGLTWIGKAGSAWTMVFNIE